MLLERYGYLGIIRLIRDTIFTKLYLPKARLIRMPFDFRGRNKILIGTGFTTGRYCRIEAYGDKELSLIIGKNCQLNDAVHIVAAKKIIIGDNVLIASRVFITDLNHGDYSDDNSSHPDSYCSERVLTSSPVTIGNNVWLGEGVAVLPGVTIGKNSIVGANSVVTKNIPENSIVVGNPAKIIKQYDFLTKKWLKVS